MSEVSLFLSGLSRYGDGLQTLETLLSRARYQSCPTQNTEQSLLQLFGLERSSADSLPIAAITALIDQPPAGITDSSAQWMRVEPVHLRADLKRVFLFDSSHFNLDDAEAGELRGLLEEVFRARGLRLVGSQASDRWYLQLERLPDIKTHSVSEVRGCDVLSFLPSGTEGGWWRTLHNEVQMTLHECAVNQRRERLGAMPINAVWFSGQGSLPAAPSQRWGRVCATDVLSEALACHSGADFCEASDSVGRVAELINGLPAGFDDVLIVNPVATDLQGLEEGWLAPLRTALRKGRIKRLNILTEDAQFTLSRAALACFWKSRKPLSTLFADNDQKVS